MKKEGTMKYLRGELLTIGLLTVVLIAAMAGVMVLDSNGAVVQSWASDFYYQLVRL